jgi:hypothetical protein
MATDSIWGGKAMEADESPEFELEVAPLGLTTVELTLDADVPVVFVAVAENV